MKQGHLYWQNGKHLIDSRRKPVHFSESFGKSPQVNRLCHQTLSVLGVSPLVNSAKIHTKPCAGLRLERAQRFDYPLLLSKHIYFEKLALKWH